MNAKAVKRGCGTRQAGGIYGECGLSPDGLPLEWFLCDPPVRTDAAALGLSSIGVKLIEREGVHHVFDIVGAKHYPNVADFVEEVRRFGLSRRLPRTLDYSKLTPESRIVLLHSRAHIGATQEYWKRIGFLQQYKKHEATKCIKNLADHANMHFYPRVAQNMCATLWWHDIQGGENTGEESVLRKMPAFEYEGFQTPAGFGGAFHELAIFASFPVKRLVVIDDPKGKSHEQALKATSNAKLPVEVEPE